MTVFLISAWSKTPTKWTQQDSSEVFLIADGGLGWVGLKRSYAINSPFQFSLSV